MSEIKYRVWDKEFKRMGMVNTIWWDSKLKIRNVLYYYPINNYGVQDVASSTAPILNLELMKFSGRKDDNGKEVWEGDIVSFNSPACDSPIEVIDIIRYSDLDMCWYAGNWKINGASELIVIGNIYENPMVKLTGHKY